MTYGEIFISYIYVIRHRKGKIYTKNTEYITKHYMILIYNHYLTCITHSKITYFISVALNCKIYMQKMVSYWYL